jgi:AraC-like DNA-binding protein
LNNKQKLDVDHALPKKLAPGSVRVGVLKAIPELLRTHTGTPFEKICAELGIPTDLLENPDNSISFQKVGRLFDLCVSYTGIAHFGLLLGQQAGPAEIGQLAKLAVYSPDVKSALKRMIVHVSIHDRGGAPILTQEHHIARLGYAIYEPLSVGGRYINEASIGIMCNLMRSMCGKTWAPSEILFSHSRPEDTSPYESFFKSQLVFDADIDALVFPEYWLEHTIPGADEQQLAFIVHQIQQMETEMDIGLIEKIRSIVRPLIAFHSCSLANIANMLILHPRTLNRQLKQQGTTLRRIIGETRFEMAKQLLLESDATITEISTLLGYTDSSILARSFQRWTNLSPSKWRTQNR